MEEFEQLYKEHSAMVYSIALNYLQNKEDAEEVTQDVFLKAHQKLKNFRADSSTKTWIYRITVNQSLYYIKAKKSNKRSILTTAEELSKVKKANFEHPGVVLEKKEQAALLLKCINTLPDQQKTAFLLSKMEGLKQEEIAKIMDKSVSGIESLIFRAKQNLRKIISNKWNKQQGF